MPARPALTLTNRDGSNLAPHIGDDGRGCARRHEWGLPAEPLVPAPPPPPSPQTCSYARVRRQANRSQLQTRAYGTTTRGTNTARPSRPTHPPNMLTRTRQQHCFHLPTWAYVLHTPPGQTSHTTLPFTTPNSQASPNTNTGKKNTKANVEPSNRPECLGTKRRFLSGPPGSRLTATRGTNPTTPSPLHIPHATRSAGMWCGMRQSLATQLLEEPTPDASDRSLCQVSHT